MSRFSRMLFSPHLIMTLFLGALIIFRSCRLGCIHSPMSKHSSASPSKVNNDPSCSSNPYCCPQTATRMDVWSSWHRTRRGFH
ncbi:hypothetical protein BJ166DRAFT_515586 [Pestalotiopsis sp. NC0098]|nr:hypothetical protein BJ166DRAFT_515586 [Pestalotiopsis sp. NC0098]